MLDLTDAKHLMDGEREGKCCKHEKGFAAYVNNGVKKLEMFANEVGEQALYAFVRYDRNGLIEVT